MTKKTLQISITTEYITLGQFLKVADVISTGGEAKSYLASHKVVINSEPDNRRGRKLRDGDKVELDCGVYEVHQK